MNLRYVWQQKCLHFFPCVRRIQSVDDPVARSDEMTVEHVAV